MTHPFCYEILRICSYLVFAAAGRSFILETNRSSFPGRQTMGDIQQTFHDLVARMLDTDNTVFFHHFISLKATNQTLGTAHVFDHSFTLLLSEASRSRETVRRDPSCWEDCAPLATLRQQGARRWGSDYGVLLNVWLYYRLTVRTFALSS